MHIISIYSIHWWHLPKHVDSSNLYMWSKDKKGLNARVQACEPRSKIEAQFCWVGWYWLVSKSQSLSMTTSQALINPLLKHTFRPNHSSASTIHELSLRAGAQSPWCLLQRHGTALRHPSLDARGLNSRHPNNKKGNFNMESIMISVICAVFNPFQYVDNIVWCVWFTIDSISELV